MMECTLVRKKIKSMGTAGSLRGRGDPLERACSRYSSEAHEKQIRLSCREQQTENSNTQTSRANEDESGGALASDSAAKNLEAAQRMIHKFAEPGSGGEQATPVVD